MKQYQTLLRHILEKGEKRNDRTGTGTIGIFGYQMRFDLSEGFPLLTTKRIHWKSVVYELLWFLRGESNIAYLKQNGVSIWDEWADEKGELGRIYGVQWRSWRGSNGQTIDQIADVISQIKKKPESRRLLVSAWNVAEISDMALPPCHALFQFYVSGNKLSCQLYQRSGDVFLGVPFNIASYSLLTHMIAHECGLEAGEFVHTLGDAHVYLNHTEQANLLLSREPRNLPQISLNPDKKSVFDFDFEDIQLLNYQPMPAIKAPISV